MVDGKGGNLKTIHHYNTERVQIAVEPFRLSLHSLHGPSAPPASICKKKGGALLLAAFFSPSAPLVCRNGFFIRHPVPCNEKIILLNRSGIGTWFFPFVAFGAGPAFFSLHTMLCFLLLRSDPEAHPFVPDALSLYREYIRNRNANRAVPFPIERSMIEYINKTIKYQIDIIIKGKDLPLGTGEFKTGYVKRNRISACLFRTQFL